MSRLRTTALCLLVGVAACQRATAEPEEPPPETRFERDMTLRFHMHQSFDLVRAIERLLIRGDLEQARRFAEAIATAPGEPSHGPWASSNAAVRERAAALARAATVEDALRKETQLAAACATCHREHTAGMFEKPPAEPPDRPTLDARMARHRWAADRLWEAVVGDADDAWRGGLDVLARAPIDHPPGLAPYARELRRLAIAARRAPPEADRATAYGEILITCAGCHAARPANAPSAR